MFHKYLISLLILSICGCGSRVTTVHTTADPLATNATAAPETTAAETTTATLVAEERALAVGSGATRAPSGWFLRHGATWAELSTEDRAIRIRIEEHTDLVPQQRDAALATAWRIFGAPVGLTQLSTLDSGANDLWQERLVVQYRTQEQATRTAFAAISRHGNRTYLALLDGIDAELGRQANAWQLILSTLRAPGAEETSWRELQVRSPSANERATTEQFIARALAETQIPGAAVAVIGRDGLLFAQGFGVRAQGANQPVTARTLFMIGSCTKQFTSLMMARLVERGVFTWDQRAVDVLPTFATGSPELTQQITMRHLPCACTGIPRRDLEFVFEIESRTAETALAELAQMQPTTPFGESYQYSNQMVAAAGFIAAHARYPRLGLEAAWRRAFREEVLAPLQMRSSTLTIREALRREHASPHSEYNSADNRVSIAPLGVDLERSPELFGPAGGLWSNLEDLARYVQMELRNGELANGSRYLAADSQALRRTRMVRVDASRGYALGLSVAERHGVTTYAHGGGTFGFTSSLEYIPELGIGFVVLRNVSSATDGLFAKVVVDKLREDFLGIDYDEEAALTRELSSLETLLEAQRTGMRTIRPEEIASWLGTFESPRLGHLRLEQSGGDFFIDVGEWRARIGMSAQTPNQIVILDAPLRGLPIDLVDDGRALAISVEATPLRAERVHDGRL